MRMKSTVGSLSKTDLQDMLLDEPRLQKTSASRFSHGHSTSFSSDKDIPNFIDCVFLQTRNNSIAKQKLADDHITLINQKQFSTVTKLFDDYYNNHEPSSIYDNIRALRQRLTRKKVLNVNVVEDEHAKIKKENQGKGALLNTNLTIDDPNMR